jgi:hypothetical protein
MPEARGFFPAAVTDALVIVRDTYRGAASVLETLLQRRYMRRR